MFIAQNITKRFAGVTALNQVNLSLPLGQVTAIVGENGAGKSTLMNVLSGVYQDYEGELIWKGETVRFANPKEAQEAGISIIHQELNLIPYLSITENIFLGRELTNSLGLLDQAKMKKRTSELLERLQLKVSPDTLISELKVGQQQIVEIAKALLWDSEVIIMDEPTSAISDREVEVLFSVIEDLRRANKAVAYISHKLAELFRMADRFVVLRDGQTVDSGDMQDMTHDLFIRKMVGREVQVNRRICTDTCFRKLLQVEGISLLKGRATVLDNISFEVGKGEVVGIFGLMGAGRTELLEAIFGLHNGNVRGQLSMNDEPVSIKTPSDAIRIGMALVPEDRKKNGLVLGMDIAANMSLTTLEALESYGLLDDQSEQALAKHYIKELNIKTSSAQQKAKNLSGGNQQKIVLGKWLATKPQLLLLDEPTRGIDIHAKSEIYKLILQLAAEGLGIVVVSSEIPEILALSDRILVLAEGKLTAEFPACDVTEDELLKAAIPPSV